ncbi:MAG: hypothetical protein IPO92_17995 [Saprospiraceae bacterium]|nr:hypothetical protein [Saprospiraceae bacterium]
MPIVITPAEGYHTIKNGDWGVGTTWLCGTPPPNMVEMDPIHIWHELYTYDTVQTADINMYKKSSLILHPNSVLTLGGSSDGLSTGHSNKVFSGYEGRLILDHATLNVNGSFYSGNYNSSQNFDGINKDTVYKLTFNNQIFDFTTKFNMIDVKKIVVDNGQVVSGNLAVSRQNISKNIFTFTRETKSFNDSDAQKNEKPYSELKLTISQSLTKIKNARELFIKNTHSKWFKPGIYIKTICHIQ